jgi:hypothetical protein
MIDQNRALTGKLAGGSVDTENLGQPYTHD